MALGTVTVGATRRAFVPTIVDENGNVVSLSTTLANLRLQGRSADLPAVTINKVADAVDGPAGTITFNDLGALVTTGNLSGANLKRATFKLKVRYVDIAAKTDFTSEFEIIWEQDPLTLV